MKTVTCAAVLTAIAGPALAHGGAHLHPHNVEIPLVVMLAAAAVSAATILFFKRK
jgi:hypothetical protein